jgi:hypothetical protein
MNYTIKPAARIEFEVKSLYEAFEKLSDGRKRRGRRHELALILTLSVLAKLAGEDEPEGMADWVKLRGERLRHALGLSCDKLPHAVTYRRVLGHAVNIEEFERVVGQFFETCGGPATQLAMDGKRMRGTICDSFRCFADCGTIVLSKRSALLHIGDGWELRKWNRSIAASAITER